MKFRCLKIIVVCFIFLIFIFSCKTKNISGINDESKHAKDPIEAWVFSGIFKGDQQKHNIGFTYILVHSYDINSNKEGMSAFLTLADFTTKINISDVAYSDFDPDSIPDFLPVKFQLSDGNECWKITGEDGCFRLNANMSKYPGSMIRLRIKNDSKRYRLPDSFNQFSDGARLFIYPSINISGKVKLNKEKYKVSTNSNYWKIWNAADFINKDQRVEQFVIHTEKSEETILITIKLSKDGSLNKYIGYTINSSTDEIKKLDNLSITVLDFWTSKASGKKYPLSMKINIPEKNQEIILTPEFNEQEMTLLKSATWIGFGKIITKSPDKELKGDALMFIN